MAIWGFIPFSDFIPYSFLLSVENHCWVPSDAMISWHRYTLIQLLSESQLQAFGFGGTSLWPNVSCVLSCSTHACSLVGAERLCESPLRPFLRGSLCSCRVVGSHVVNFPCWHALMPTVRPAGCLIHTVLWVFSSSPPACSCFSATSLPPCPFCLAYFPIIN